MKQEISIAGYAFTPIETKDSFQKAIARHELPDRALPLLEDLGLKEHTVRIRCWFVGGQYDKHFEFLDTLRKQGPVELWHPRYGSLTGSIDSVSIRHDRRKRICEVELSFVQGGVLLEHETLAYDIQGAIEALLAQGITEQQDSMAADARTALGVTGADIAEKELDPDKGLLEQFSELAGRARQYVKAVEEQVTTVEAAFAEVENTTSSLIATIDYAANLPGRVIGSVARAAERCAVLYQSVQSAPARFMQSYRTGMLQLRQSLDGFDSDSLGSIFTSTRASAGTSVAKRLSAVGAMAGALYVAYAYDADEENRNLARMLEGVPAFGPDGSYQDPPAIPPVLNVRDIETSLAAVRTYLQETIDEDRDGTSRQEMSRELLRHVNTVKLEKEKLTTVEVDPAMPLHLVCLRHGLPWSWAPRVLALNPQIENPNFVSGEVMIYAS